MEIVYMIVIIEAAKVGGGSINRKFGCILQMKNTLIPQNGMLI